MLGKKTTPFERRFVKDQVFLGGLPYHRTPRSFWRQDIWLFLLIVVFDQLTKHTVLTWIPKGVYHEVTSFFNLVHVQNKGISFGLFPAGSSEGLMLLVTLSMGILTFLSIWYYRAKDAWVCRGLICVMAGAVGNLIDRLLHGGVIDFLDFHLDQLHFPAFNIADTAITLGAMILILIQLLEGSAGRS